MAVEMLLLYMLVSLLAASQLLTSSGAVGMGIFPSGERPGLHEGWFVVALFRAAKSMQWLVMPGTALCSGKAPTGIRKNLCPYLHYATCDQITVIQCLVSYNGSFASLTRVLKHSEVTATDKACGLNRIYISHTVVSPKSNLT
jgi:hypothetical protein